MSHANGEIWSEDGNLIGFFEYDGTSDITRTRVYLSHAEMKAHWRGDNWRDCKCEAAGQPVILYTDYADGYHWAGRVCWNCMAITDGIGVYDIDVSDGHPFKTTSLFTPKHLTA